MSNTKTRICINKISHTGISWSVKKWEFYSKVGSPGQAHYHSVVMFSGMVILRYWVKSKGNGRTLRDSAGCSRVGLVTGREYIRQCTAQGGSNTHGQSWSEQLLPSSLHIYSGLSFPTNYVRRALIGWMEHVILGAHAASCMVKRLIEGEKKGRMVAITLGENLQDLIDQNTTRRTLLVFYALRVTWARDSGLFLFCIMMWYAKVLPCGLNHVIE